MITSSKAALRTPLLFDPGEQGEYGSNIDWAGQVKASPAIFKPLGITTQTAWAIKALQPIQG